MTRIYFETIFPYDAADDGGTIEARVAARLEAAGTEVEEGPVAHGSGWTGGGLALVTGYALVPTESHAVARNNVVAALGTRTAVMAAPQADTVPVAL